MVTRILKFPIIHHPFWAMINMGRDFKNLWAHRELLLTLTKREIVARYKQTFFGLGWSLMQPILQTVVYTIAFSVILKSPSAEGIPYAIFVFANLTLWTYFATTTINAMNSLRANSALITKVSFPREIIPISVILSGLFDFIVTFIVLVVLNLFFGFYPNWRFIYIPAILFVEILFILNLSLILSVLTVARRDLTYVVTFFITLYMFLTPVFFPLTALPESIRQYYFLSPMGAIIDAFKNAVFYNYEPKWYSLLIASTLLIVLFIPSYKFFKRAEKLFADVL
ncbi:MAG: ABC transporter permease [Ignavibacteriales bacterium]|nr:ABC transporter permease [Ignavibacteriales bacterium]